MRTLAVLGAGPGIGRSIASRFGREGFQVGLVARNEQQLSTMVGELAAEGVAAAAFPADLSDRTATTSAVTSIVERFGPIDVLEYGPLPGEELVVNAQDLDVDTAQKVFDLLVLGAIHAADLVLPAMRERGAGALLFTQGVSARHPLTVLASVGMAASALRNWIYCLHQELAPEGVYVGSVTVAAMVVRGADPSNAMMIEADEIGEHHWALYEAREHVEDYVGNLNAFEPPPGWV